MPLQNSINTSAVGFYAYLAANVTNYCGNSGFKSLPTDTKKFDTTNSFDMVTGVYSIPQSGLYQVSCGAGISNITIGGTFYVMVTGASLAPASTAGNIVNPTVSKTAGDVGSAEMVSSTFSTTLYLEEGDEIDYALVSGGEAADTQTVSSFNDTLNGGQPTFASAILVSAIVIP